jgi:hypothetical protein
MSHGSWFPVLGCALVREWHASEVVRQYDRSSFPYEIDVRVHVMLHLLMI